MALELAGAERCVPTLGCGAQQRIAATATTGGETVIAQLCDEPVTAAALRETVLQYVLRTRESIMLDDALAEPAFATLTCPLR